jgi:hypothetical protein
MRIEFLSPQCLTKCRKLGKSHLRISVPQISVVSSLTIPHDRRRLVNATLFKFLLLSVYISHGLYISATSPCFFYEVPNIACQWSWNWATIYTLRSARANGSRLNPCCQAKDSPLLTPLWLRLRLTVLKSVTFIHSAIRLEAIWSLLTLFSVIKTHGVKLQICKIKCVFLHLTSIIFLMPRHFPSLYNTVY